MIRDHQIDKLRLAGWQAIYVHPFVEAGTVAIALEHRLSDPAQRALDVASLHAIIAAMRADVDLAVAVMGDGFKVLQRHGSPPLGAAGPAVMP